MRFILNKFKIYKIKYRDHSNRFILHMPDGTTVYNPKYIRGYHVEFFGKNATLEIYEPCKLKGSKILLYNHDHFVLKQTIGAIFVQGGACCSGHTHLFIDEGCTLNNTHFYLNSCPNAFITLGKDCMFSTDIRLWASDTHQIISQDDQHIINKKYGITIGNHIWCGTRCTILKNTTISDNSIIGAASVVSGHFNEPNIIIAGNPAKKIKENVNWLRESLPD